MKLLILTAAAHLFGRPRGFSTSNAVADEIAALKDQFAALQAQNAALQQQLEAAKTAATRPVDELDLGPFRLPEGVDPKDVRWRVRAGLDLKQAVEAAIAQKAHDEASEGRAPARPGTQSK